MNVTPKWTAALGVALAAGFTVGLVALFNAEFAAGEVYPEFSTFRADPGGAKLLFDSLSHLEGLTVERNFLPLENLAPEGSTIVLLGLKDLDLDVIGKLAKSGARVVAALGDDWAPAPEDDNRIFKEWQVKIAVHTEKHAPVRLSFSEADGWSVIDRTGAQVTAIERPFGKGSVAFFASSIDFTNRAAVDADRLEPVSAALGANSHIVFDESHLGIAESGSVMGLARRFHLMGIAAGFAILAALFIWRNASAFPPPEATEKDLANRLTGRTSASGLLTLLRKNVTPRELTAACWQEWLAGRRREFSADRIERAEAIVRGMADRPLEAAREIHEALHSKGVL